MGNCSPTEQAELHVCVLPFSLLRTGALRSVPKGFGREQREKRADLLSYNKRLVIIQPSIHFLFSSFLPFFQETSSNREEGLWTLSLIHTKAVLWCFILFKKENVEGHGEEQSELLELGKKKNEVLEYVKKRKKKS